MRLRLRPVVVLPALLFLACSSSTETRTLPSVRPLPGPRLLVFISDLHLGVGRQEDGTWHPFEDFRWGREFALFLKKIHEVGNGKTDLIFNGDTFELWQSLAKDCSKKRVGCTESEAVGRIRRVLSQHNAELQAIGEFANADENRVVLVPGNHDAALLFPAVARAVLEGIPAMPGRARVATEGYWLSADHVIYAEHGHQIGQEVNRFDAWPRPFVRVWGQMHLQKPWGEQFVQKYYNKWELKYPIIDNISDEGNGVRYGLAAEGPIKGATAVAEFLRFLLVQVSWKQFIQSVGGGDAPATWDLQRVREEGLEFIVNSLHGDDPLKVIVQRAASERAFKFEDIGVTDDEIVAVCDQRALVRQSEILTRGSSTMSECPRVGEHLGAVSEYLFRSRDKIFSEHLQKTYGALADSGQSARPFKVFIFSHTHRADPGFYPLVRTNPSWNPVVVNTGAWQRVIHTEQIEEIKRRRQLTDEQILIRLRLEDLPACYSVVLIEPTGKYPVPMLRYWRETKPDEWGLVPEC